MTIDGLCSIYTAESVAIEMAIDSIEEQDMNKDILVLTDSQSVCIDLMNNKLNAKKHKNIVRIRERIFRYDRFEEKKKRRVKVVIGWIPGHEGTEENEITNGLAKEAVEEEKDERIKIPHVDWRIVQKNLMEERIKLRIETEGRYKGVKYFKEYYNKDSNKPWFRKLNEDKGLINMINSLRSNHYNLNKSLHRKGYIESLRCECGADNQSIMHVAMVCRQFDDYRKEIYERLAALEIPYLYDIEVWLRTLVIRSLLKILWKFLRRIGKIV